MARRVLHTFSFLTLLAAALVVQSNAQIEVISQKLEDALFSNSNLLYMMQEVFIPSKLLPHDLVYLHVCVTVGSVLPGDCDNSSLFGGQSNFTYCQRFQWSSSALVDLISVDQLLILDNVISHSIYHLIEHHGSVDVPLHIDTLPCETMEDDILAALMQLLPWVKSYARVHGQRNDNDKGYVSILYSVHVAESYYILDTRARHFYRLSLLLTFIFLNILTPVALAKSTFLYFPRIRAKSSTGDFIGCLYWATAVVAFLLNVLYIAASIRHTFWSKPAITFCLIHPNCSVPSYAKVYNDDILTLLAVYIIIPSTDFIELLVCILAVKYAFHDQKNLRHGDWCPSHKQCFLQSIHVLALWNILISLQLLTMIATPICVLLFVHPQVTVLTTILLLLVPASLVVIIAYLLYHCQPPRWRRVCCNAKRCGLIFVQLFVMIAIVGLILALLALYEVMLLVQVQIGSGVKGLIFSLLPSFPLSALGWYLKRRSQKKAEHHSDSETPQLMVGEQLSKQMFENSRPLPV